jgi:glutamine amidotransferase
VIAVVDCGISNLRSVLNALERVGAEARVASAPADLDGAGGVILPGVGAFGDGMRNLDRAGFTDVLPRLAAEGRPLLGICLGMQLLATRSHEYGDHAGLDIVSGTVERIVTHPELRIPHVGWNTIDVAGDGVLLDGLSDEPAFYFVHSYHLVPEDRSVVTATTEYGVELTACVQRDNVFGVQFHPEKSQADGLRLLENFVAAC